MKRKKLLCILLLIVLNITIVFGLRDVFFNIFQNGKVVTLRSEGGQFFLRTDYFDSSGNHTSPSSETMLTAEQYANIKKSGAYDYEVRILHTVLKGKYLEVIEVTDKNGKRIDELSSVGELIGGTFTPIIFADNRERRDIYITDVDKYYRVTKYVDASGNYTKDAIIVPLSKDAYKESIARGGFDYEQVTTVETSQSKTVKVTTFLDDKGNHIKEPIVVELTGFTNIQDYLKAAEYKPTEQDKTDNEKEPDSDGYYDENGNFIPFPEEEKSDSGKLWDNAYNDNPAIVDAWEDYYEESTPSIGFWSDSSEEEYRYDSSWSDIGDLGPKIEMSLDWGEDSGGNYGFSYSEDMDSKSQTPNLEQQLGGKFDDYGNFYPNNQEGYYDSEGVYHPALKGQATGKYDQHGNFYLEGVDGYIDASGVYHPSKAPKSSKTAILDKNGNIIADGEKGSYLPGGGFVKNLDQAQVPYRDSQGNLHLPGLEGYIDSEGVYHPPYDPNSPKIMEADGGYFDAQGNFHTADGRVGYFDEKGVFHEGTNPYANGFFDANGVFRDFKGNEIPKESAKVRIFNEKGELVESSTPSGDRFYDHEGNLHTKGESGFYDKEGNYYALDSSGITITEEDLEKGYYEKDGVFVPVKPKVEMKWWEKLIEWIKGLFVKIFKGNPFADGFYDKEGNFTLNDFSGYFDKNGNFHTLDGKVGYFNENGQFTEGENPYQGGFYDHQGVFHENGIWQKGYYDHQGNFIANKANPYAMGSYDKEGNFHLLDGSGYFDKDGTFHGKDGSVGHYDAQGNFIEGSNPDVNGYYDKDGTYYKNKIRLKGYYNEKGELIPNEPNPYARGYFDSKGVFHLKGEALKRKAKGIGYFDAQGNFHLDGDLGYYDTEGNYHSVDGKVGYYDKHGAFHEGETNPYEDGFYDAEGNFHPFGSQGYYDAQGNFHPSVTGSAGGYYDAQGNFIKGKANPYAYGYYDAEGNFHLKDGSGYFDKEGTFHTADGRVGYFDEKGVFHEGKNPYQGGYYDAHGNFIQNGEQITGYFDKSGVYHQGVNPYEGGFYDASGNWYPEGTKGYFDSEGNFHPLDRPEKIGVFDAEGNYYAQNDAEGYYDKTGTYHTKDGRFGYFDKDGNFIEGKPNPYEEGFYDKDGNFHKFGDQGYIDKDGVYHENVNPDIYGYYDKDGVFHEGQTNPYKEGYYDAEGNFHLYDGSGYFDKEGNFHSADGKVGYFDEKGVFHEGKNPYEGGYYDASGKWHSFANPYPVGYFDKAGNFIEGRTNPYEDGYYDAQGNWHLEDGSGYYDKYGNFHPASNPEDVGYYDKFGNYHKGTNPYKGGYYDKYGNWHPFGDSGYYDAERNYHTADGRVGYFDEKGVFHEGKNPYQDGFYDKDGNFHPFDRDVIITKDGKTITPYTVDESKKDLASNNLKIQGDAYSIAGDENSYALRTSNKTIQFTLNKNAENPLYIDTGIFVPVTNLITFEMAMEAMHQVAITTNSNFITDTDKGMFVFEGRIITLYDNEKLSVGLLRDKLADTTIEIKVAPTKIGTRDEVSEALTNTKISKADFDGKVVTLYANPIGKADDVLIPLKNVAEGYGYGYDFNKDTVTLTKAEERLVFRVGSDKVRIGNTEKSINYPLVVQSNQPMVSAKFIADYLGKVLLLDTRKNMLIFTD